MTQIAQNIRADLKKYTGCNILQENTHNS